MQASVESPQMSHTNEEFSAAEERYMSLLAAFKADYGDMDCIMDSPELSESAIVAIQ